MISSKAEVEDCHYTTDCQSAGWGQCCGEGLVSRNLSLSVHMNTTWVSQLPSWLLQWSPSYQEASWMGGQSRLVESGINSWAEKIIVLFCQDWYELVIHERII